MSITICSKEDCEHIQALIVSNTQFISAVCATCMFLTTSNNNYLKKEKDDNKN